MGTDNVRILSRPAGPSGPARRAESGMMERGEVLRSVVRL